MTPDGKMDAAIATPTSDPTFPPSIAKATPNPDRVAVRIPTQRERSIPLKYNTKELNLSYQLGTLVHLILLFNKPVTVS